MRPHNLLQQIYHWLSLLALLPLGLLFGASTGPGRGVQRLTKADENSTVHLHPGERLEVTLSGNPNTGYTWELNSIDEKILRLLGKPEYRPSSGATGSGGEFTFAFEAQRPGQTVLRLVYCRSWEKDKQPAEGFEVVVLCIAH